MAKTRFKVDGVEAIYVNEGTGSGATVYANRAAFPATPAATDPQQFAIANDTGGLYCSFNGNWCFIAILAP